MLVPLIKTEIQNTPLKQKLIKNFSQTRHYPYLRDFTSQAGLMDTMQTDQSPKPPIGSPLIRNSQAQRLRNTRNKQREFATDL